MQGAPPSDWALWKRGNPWRKSSLAATARFVIPVSASNSEAPSQATPSPGSSAGRCAPCGRLRSLRTTCPASPFQKLASSARLDSFSAVVWYFVTSPTAPPFPAGAITATLLTSCPPSIPSTWLSSSCNVQLPQSYTPTAQPLRAACATCL
eukprot:CAMPEP_0177758412 /NCGR_PEP_ID=MMETSP0491_2-20121128/4170_1 /TAXON_ID=63592 /ORGANISM="Tetraselmis chuii, Strain PLY429" /LENGTH=150 /DNA_ID=CAMNT_0019274143 /DNA_START=911 /DNA_END=1361 /DNA_ORIENTATION=-